MLMEAGRLTQQVVEGKIGRRAGAADLAELSRASRRADGFDSASKS